MEQGELISVVIPVYKVEKYLRRCIDSILNQTYGNYEIILVDDGSPDDCGKICDWYATQYSKIRVFHKKNGGLSDARNYGVEQARGEYIAFIDSDDYVEPDYLAYLYGLLKKHNADISVCCMIKTEEDSAAFGENKELPIESVLTGYDACVGLMRSLYMVLVTAWGKLIKNEIVKKYPFPVGKKHEDEATTCKYYYESNKVVVGNQCLYAYFQNDTGIMHTLEDSVNMDSIWAMEHRSRFFEEKQEKKLMNMSWYKLFDYCVWESSQHNGRYDFYLSDFDQNKKLSFRTRFEVRLYNNARWAFTIYRKIWIMCRGVKNAMKGIR